MDPEPLSPGDVVQAIHYYRVDEQTCMNVFYYVIKQADAGGLSNYFDDITNIAQKLATNLTQVVQGWRGLATADCTSVAMQAQRIWPSRDYYLSIPVNQVGLRNAPSAPSIVALSVTKRSIMTGRGRSGHMQLAGLPAVEMDNGRWTNDMVADAQTYADNIGISAIFGVSGEMDMVLWDGTDPGGSRKIIAYEAKNELRSMHRRTVGLGI